MVWFLLSVVVLILGASAVVASGRWGQMPSLEDERLVTDLPPGPLAADDVREVRFAVVPRGYAMAEVDQLLARLADQLEGRSREPMTPPGGAGMGIDATDAE